MRYELQLLDSRIKYLDPNDVRYIELEKDNGKTLIMVWVETANDLLSLFHAGIDCGFEIAVNSKNKTA